MNVAGDAPIVGIELCVAGIPAGTPESAESLVRRGEGCLVAGLAGAHAGEAARPNFRISPSFGCADATTSPHFRIGHGEGIVRCSQA